jgi:hypothetical protein
MLGTGFEFFSGTGPKEVQILISEVVCVLEVSSLKFSDTLSGTFEVGLLRLKLLVVFLNDRLSLTQLGAVAGVLLAELLDVSLIEDFGLSGLLLNRLSGSRGGGFWCGSGGLSGLYGCISCSGDVFRHA